MPKLPPKSMTLQRADQVRALASPTRHAVYQAVQHQGEASVRDIAAQLGRHPASLYKHIDILEESGIIWEVGTRATGKRDARVFGSQWWWIRHNSSDSEMTDALNAYVQSQLRNAGRKMAESFETNAVTRGRSRDTCFASVFGWLTKEELGELNDLLDQVTDLMKDKFRRPGTRLIGTMPLLYPVPMGSRAIDVDE